MKKTIIVLVTGSFLLGACGQRVALEKQTTEHETCVYEQRYHKFWGNDIGEKTLVACTPTGR